MKQPRTESFTGIGFHRSPTARADRVGAARRRCHARAAATARSTIEHVNGRIELNTGDGSIRATDVAGELTLHTGDGSVTVDGAEGRLDSTPATAA